MEHNALNEECLMEHNRLRKLHGCIPLKLDAELARRARSYAEKLAEMDTFEHDQSNEYGENLAVRTSEDGAILTGKQATLMWYSEISFYDFTQENQLACGHFSQIVWKSTTHAGFGTATKADGRKVFIVGIYMPPGNFQDEWCENVPPPVSGHIYIPSKAEIYGDLYTPKVPPNKDVLVENQEPVQNGTANENSDSIILVNGNGHHVTAHNFARCLKQECALVFLKSFNPERCEHAVDVHEWFRTTDRVTGKTDDYETHTWYDAFTGMIIEPVNETEIQQTLRASEDLLQAFRIEVLHTQNRYRRMHGAPALKKNQKLDELAQTWANALRDAGEPSYSDWYYESRPLGELVCYRFTENNRISAETLVSKWYKESLHYDYTREPESGEKLGHFTQLVWKNTTELGVGFVPSNEPNLAYIVCFYHPPGNVKGCYVDNVQPAINSVA